MLYWPIMAHQVLKLQQQKSQQCSAIKKLNLFNKYLLLVTLKTDDNYSIRNEKHYSHNTKKYTYFLTTITINSCTAAKHMTW